MASQKKLEVVTVEDFANMQAREQLWDFVEKHITPYDQTQCEETTYILYCLNDWNHFMGYNLQWFHYFFIVQGTLCAKGHYKTNNGWKAYKRK